MKNRSLKTMTLLALLLLLPVEILGAEIVVIGHKDFPQDNLTMSELRKVYLGRKTEVGGIPISPLDQADETPVKKGFIRKILGSSLVKYKSYWLKLVFREGRTPPRVLLTSEDMLKAVRRDPGGIGYLLSDELINLEGVKVLLKFSTGP